MPPTPRVTLYGRPGCHLCDAAEATLRKLAPTLRFSLMTVDIEEDAALLQRYMLEIPVVAIDGREIAFAPIDPRQLESALREALGR